MRYKRPQILFILSTLVLGVISVPSTTLAVDVAPSAPSGVVSTSTYESWQSGLRNTTVQNIATTRPVPNPSSLSAAQRLSAGMRLTPGSGVGSALSATSVAVKQLFDSMKTALIPSVTATSTLLVSPNGALVASGWLPPFATGTASTTEPSLPRGMPPTLPPPPSFLTTSGLIDVTKLDPNTIPLPSGESLGILSVGYSGGNKVFKTLPLPTGSAGLVLKYSGDISTPFFWGNDEKGSGGGGGANSGHLGRLAFYASDGSAVSETGAGMVWDNVLGALVAPKINISSTITLGGVTRASWPTGGVSDLIWATTTSGVIHPIMNSANTLVIGGNATSTAGISLEVFNNALFNGGIVATGTAGGVIVSGAGARFMWVPAKAALRAGVVSGTEWDTANIGQNSIALGQNTRAIGSGGIAIGDNNSSGSGVAIGDGNTTDGPNSATIGSTNTTNGDGNQFLFGSNNSASGGYVVAVGVSNNLASAGTGRFAFGSNNVVAMGNQEYAFGDNNSLTGSAKAVALGNHNSINGVGLTGALALGNYTKITGQYGATLGMGVGGGNELWNNVNNSLFVGFNSNLPTLFVGPSAGVGTTGDVGIGTSTPSAKLSVQGTGGGGSLIFNLKDVIGTQVFSVDDSGNMASAGQTILANLSVGNIATTTSLVVDSIFASDYNIINIMNDFVLWDGRNATFTGAVRVNGNLYVDSPGTSTFNNAIEIGQWGLNVNNGDLYLGYHKIISNNFNVDTNTGDAILGGNLDAYGNTNLYNLTATGTLNVTGLATSTFQVLRTNLMLVDTIDSPSQTDAIYVARSMLIAGVTTTVDKLVASQSVKSVNALIEGSLTVGTTSWQAGLYTERPNDLALYVNRTGSDGKLVSIQRDGVEEGDISVAAGTVSYNAFTGSHYAWLSDDTINNGTLVSLSGDNKRLHDNLSSEIIYGVVKTAVANDSQVLGSYLGRTNPSATSSVTEDPHLVMAVGNGDLWVADSSIGGGQNVAIGDYLISSDVAGHAMVNPGTYDKANIVARAAEPVDWTTVSDTVNGVKHKKISVFFDSFVVSSGTAASEINLDNLRTNFFSGDMVGQAKILVGSSEVAVKFSQEYSTEPIVVVSPLNYIDGRYKVDDVTLGGFKIKVETPQVADTLFNWHSFAGKDSKVFVSDGTTENIQIVAPALEAPEQAPEQPAPQSPEPSPEQSLGQPAEQ